MLIIKSAVKQMDSWTEPTYKFSCVYSLCAELTTCWLEFKSLSVSDLAGSAYRILQKLNIIFITKFLFVYNHLKKIMVVFLLP